MHRRLLLAGLLTPATLARAAAPLYAVATFSVLADMVRQIGGQGVSVTGLVPPDGDVHVYQPRPSDMRAIMNAALLVQNGMGLEGWLARMTGATGFRGVVVTASTGVTPLKATEDGQTAPDPHAWQDPRNGIIYARNIAAGLAQAQPSASETYNKSGELYAARIAAMDAWVEQQFTPIPRERRRIITTHDAFAYYGARYGVEFLAAEGISTDAEPSAKGIASLIEQIKREKIRAVFLENVTDPRLARMLARETGARLGGTVYSDALSPPGGPAATYLDMLRHNTSLFVRAMAA